MYIDLRQLGESILRITFTLDSSHFVFLKKINKDKIMHVIFFNQHKILQRNVAFVMIENNVLSFIYSCTRLRSKCNKNEFRICNN